MALTKAQLIDLNANELIIDLDADTSITADTDDQIDIKIAGADDFRFTANTFTALAGSSIVVPASGLTIGSTAVTSTAAELNLIDGGASTGTTAVADADGIITNDGGTMRLTTAATFKTYFQEGISTAYDDLTAGDAAVNITTSSGNITIDAAANDSDIIFKGTDNSADITMLTLDGSAAGDATFNNQIIVGDGKLVLNSTAVTSTAAELNLLDGVSGLVQADLTKLAAIDATATELNLIDGDATVGTTAIADGDGLIINDAGTMRVSTVQTLAAYLDDEITAMPNLTTASALVTVSALDSGSITSGFGAIDNGTSNIRSATITAETAFVPDAANGASLGTTSLEFADLYLHDGAQILFGADQDVVLTHAADAGLTLKTATTSDDTKATLTLQTGDTDIAANDVLGQLHFQAPDEGAGTDAILVAAGIAAISEGDFSASNNATKLSFQTGASEAASEKMSLSSAGILTVADDIIIGDGKTIGSASDPDAITIASNGQLTLTQTLIGTALDISGDIDVDGTTNLDAVDIDGLTTCVNIHSISTSTTNQVLIENTDGGAASAPDLVLYRNSASPADDDALGRIHFRGKTDTGAENNYAYMYATAADVSNGAESGNLFIGGLIAGADRGWINMNETEVVINEDSNDMDFRVEGNNETHSLFVEGSSGRVMINTNTNTSPQPALEVKSHGSTLPAIVLQGGTSTSSGSILIFRAGDGDEVGGISMSNLNAGTTVAYNTSSDYRLKENVDYTWDATTRLKQLKPARFNFIKDETNTLVDGFLAHEVSSIVPEAITGTHNQVQVWRDGEELPNGVSVGDNKLDENGNTIPDYQSIDQSKLVPLLVKTIQELEARIKTLEDA